MTRTFRPETGTACTWVAWQRVGGASVSVAASSSRRQQPTDHVDEQADLQPADTAAGDDNDDDTARLLDAGDWHACCTGDMMTPPTAAAAGSSTVVAAALRSGEGQRSLTHRVTSSGSPGHPAVYKHRHKFN